MTTKTTKMFCTFCGNNSEEFGLVQGPTAFICFECIDLCSEMQKKNSEKIGVINPPLEVPKHWPRWCSTASLNELKAMAAQEYPSCEVQLLGGSGILWSDLIQFAEERERRNAGV